MNMSTGNSNASAATARITSSVAALAPAPAITAVLPAVAMLVTFAEPGAPASCRGACPMMMTSESGAGSADGPIVPAWRPPNRSPSSAAGVLRSSLLSAGDA